MFTCFPTTDRYWHAINCEQPNNLTRFHTQNECFELEATTALYLCLSIHLLLVIAVCRLHLVKSRTERGIHGVCLKFGAILYSTRTPLPPWFEVSHAGHIIYTILCICSIESLTWCALASTSDRVMPAQVICTKKPSSIYTKDSKVPRRTHVCLCACIYYVLCMHYYMIMCI